MSTRHPLPYVAIDSLYPGDEIRVKRVGCLPIVSVFNGFHIDADGTFWLKIACSPFWIMASEIQWRDGMPMVQFTNSTRARPTLEVVTAIMQFNSKVVLS